MDLEQLARDRVAQYANKGQTIDMDGTTKEIVAESTAQIWSSEANMCAFADANPGLFKSMVDGFMRFWERVKQIAADIARRNGYGESAALLGDDSALQKVYDTFMKVAGEKGIAVEGQQERFSINPDVYNLDREQYNKWGWATRNNVLTPNDLNQIESRSRQEFGGQNPGTQTADGFWALPVGSDPGMDNVVAVTDRELGAQDIARVYRIDSKYEDALEKARDCIYAAEEAYGRDAWSIYQPLFEAESVSFYSKEDYLDLYEQRRQLGGQGSAGSEVGKRFVILRERRRSAGILEDEYGYPCRRAVGKVQLKPGQRRIWRVSWKDRRDSRGQGRAVSEICKR